MRKGNTIFFEKSGNDWFIHFRDKDKKYLKRSTKSYNHIQTLSYFPIGHLERTSITYPDYIQAAKEIAFQYYLAPGISLWK